MKAASANHGQHEIAEWEDRAEVVCEFQTTVVPGLVQTLDYMRLIHVRLGIRQDIDDFVGVRQRRQDPYLRQADKKDLEIILMEEACGWPADEPDILKGQLEHLIHVAGLSNIDLSIIPAGESPFPTLHGYMLCEGPIPIVHAEMVDGCGIWEYDSEIAVFREHWERSKQVALDTDATVNLLDSLRGQLG